MKKFTGKRLLTIISCAVLAVIIFMGKPSVCMAYQQATGIVSADAAKVRKEPNTSSDVVAGLLKGSTVTVVDEVTDSAGMTWYKITVENNTGYIRSDLLIKASAPTANGTTTNTTAENTSSSAGNDQTAASETNSSPAPTTATPIAETKAYVNYESARVREGASTKHGIVGSVTKNTAVVITGEAKASDGKKWYQIKYQNQAGRDVTGFIRSDLLTIGEPPAQETTTEEVQPEQAEETETAGETEGENPTDAENPEEGSETAEEPPAAEPEPVETVKPDYEMVYTANQDGVEEWYLYDNINGTRQTLAGLFAAAEAGTKQSEENTKQLATQKIIIIVLAVVAAVLAVIVTLLLFKIKDLYEEDYEDEEDDEDEDDEDDEEERTVRSRRPAGNSARPISTVSPIRVSDVKEVNVSSKKKETGVTGKIEYRPEEEEFRPGKPVAENKQPKRKAKNFLLEDDEFEFEFLNMDDKN